MRKDGTVTDEEWNRLVDSGVLDRPKKPTRAQQAEMLAGCALAAVMVVLGLLTLIGSN